MSLTNFQIETLSKLRLLLLLTAVEVPDMPDPENWEQNVLDLLDALALGINNIQAGAASSLPWTSITEKPTAFPPETHSHQWSQVQNKPSEYPPESHQHGWTDLTGIPSTFAPSPHIHPEYEGGLASVAWADITGKPSTFPPDTHSHVVAWADVEGKPAAFPALDHLHLWANISDRPTSWPWADITGKPSTFPPDSHSHAVTWADVEGKPSTFAPSPHGHPWADITGKPSTFPPDSHSHAVAWADLTDRPENLTGIAAIPDPGISSLWFPAKSGVGWHPWPIGDVGQALIQAATPADGRLQIEAAAAVHGHPWGDITGKPTLGSASSLDSGSTSGKVPVIQSDDKLAPALIPGAGLLRAWALVEMVGTTPTILASSQVASVVRTSAGIFDVTLSSPAPGAGYFLPVANGHVVENWSASTSAAWIDSSKATVVHALAGTGFLDPFRFSVAFFW